MTMHVGSVFNFRDLGGFPTADGGRVRRGELFRSDGLHRLVPADVERLAEFGVRTVIDLRTVRELTDAPSLAHPRLEVIHLPVLERTWTDGVLGDVDDPVAFLRARYGEMLVEGRQALVAAVEVLASEKRRPAVFHCAAGKDRTGVLAALVLEILRVPEEIIAGDYAMTAPAMQRMVAWLEAERPDLAEVMALQPVALVACPPEAMHGFLDDLSSEYGGAESYLRAAGVAADVIEVLRAQLVAHDLD